jgi:phosphopantetheine--protein transferase-like protein
MAMNTSAVQAAGTAGEASLDQVLNYLSRLTGEPVSANSVLRLRSVHRAAFTSWARKQNIAIQTTRMNAGDCTVSQVLGAEEAPSADGAASNVVTLPVRQSPPTIGGTVGEIGIDVEEVDSLPLASDYREHPFYRDHFTPIEIAYCIRQSDTRASFCGLWAAKEAILKSGLIPSSTHLMNAFEISHDGSGRPTFPGCRLSISHTSKSAVAVCIAAGEAAAPVERIPIGTASKCEAPPPTEKKQKSWLWSRGK